ncbi:hypothetical protein B0H13DRAFT_1901288 [Mycena leptocephala]|nr:hypothetical protein B0H13DRAFT_1901288 [Mycena leptocephala]
MISFFLGCCVIFFAPALACLLAFASFQSSAVQSVIILTCGSLSVVHPAALVGSIYVYWTVFCVYLPEWSRNPEEEIAAVTPTTTVLDMREGICHRGYAACHSQGPAAMYLSGLWRPLCSSETMSGLGLRGLRHFSIPPRVWGAAPEFTVRTVVNQHGWEQGALNADGTSKSAEEIDFGPDPAEEAQSEVSPSWQHKGNEKDSDPEDSSFSISDDSGDSDSDAGLEMTHEESSGEDSPARYFARLTRNPSVKTKNQRPHCRINPGEQLRSTEAVTDWRFHLQQQALTHLTVLDPRFNYKKLQGLRLRP